MQYSGIARPPCKKRQYKTSEKSPAKWLGGPFFTTFFPSLVVGAEGFAGFFCFFFVFPQDVALRSAEKRNILLDYALPSWDIRYPVPRYVWRWFSLFPSAGYVSCRVVFMITTARISKFSFWMTLKPMWATKKNSYFPLYWLFNRDPYSGLL